MKRTTTQRGFSLFAFTDHYAAPCSIQKSSLAETDAIWLGVDDPAAKVMASQAERVGVKTNQTTGWVPYPIPKEVAITTRMHLTRAQVKEMLPILRHFVKTGELPEVDA